MTAGAGAVLHGDTWVYSSSTWTNKPAPSEPDARSQAAMAWDPARGRLVLFGGTDGVRRNDTWEWDGSAWSQKCNPCAPSARTFSALAYDVVRDTVVMYGGNDGSRKDDMWEWDGITWSLVSQGAPQPPGLNNFAMVHNNSTGNVLIFGGHCDGSSCYSNETWLWLGASWNQPFPGFVPAAQSPACWSSHSST